MTTAWDAAVTAVRAGAAPEAEADALLAELSDEEQIGLLDGDLPFWAGMTDMGAGGYHLRPFRAAQVPRLGIPGFAFSDGPRGVVIGNATCFPVSMARGATWDTDLEVRIGDAIGRELRAVGADLYGGVCVNVLRHPAWGRAQETYGEDPHHVGEMGAALTRGAQRHVMATVKHFACNSMENARFKVDVAVDEAALHEVYLPHFRRIVEEGVACVMSAYNSVNGEWCGDSPTLLTDVLRGEWGFEGFVISDWIFGLRDAGASVRAGLDVEMPAPMIRRDHLPAALAAGTVTQDDAVACGRRTLAALLRHAAFRVPQSAPADRAVLACPEHRSLAREAAAKSVVVLRNEPVNDRPLLPIEPTSASTIAVIGRLADARNLGDGGSSDVFAPEVVTLLEGFTGALGEARVLHHEGDDAVAAAALAAGADVAVVVVGFTRADEGEYIGDAGTRHLRDLLPGPDDPDLVAAFEARRADDPELVPGSVPTADSLGFATGGDRPTLALSDDHEALISAVAASQPATVVALVGGSAVTMERWRTQVPAIAQIWYSGMEGGHGVADVLLGRVDATGRLPFSIPTDEGHLPPFDREADAVTYDGWHGYWLLARDRHEAAFPFGFGLSFTTWELGPTTLEDDGDQLVVRAEVRNTGGRPGADVVQVYAGRPADDTRPARRLVAFERVEVDAGAHVDVEIRIPWVRLAIRSTETHTWSLPAGTYVLSVGRHAADLMAVDLIVDRA